jgi:hypothetical protein
MKKGILIFLFFALFYNGYCRNTHVSVISTSPTGISCRELVDTLEFISYWKKFRGAVLNRDTATLSLIINDPLEGGCFFPDYEEYNLPKNLWGRNLYKPVFLNNIDSLFTPPYLELLKEYNIEREFSLQNNNWKNRYRCSRVIEQKIYYASIYVDENKQFTYQMGYQPDSEYEIFIDIDLKFIKTPSGIKLYRIECSCTGILPHYDIFNTL